MSLTQKTGAKRRFEARLARSLLKIFTRLPLRRCHQIGSIIGWLAYLMPTKLYRHAIANVRVCLPHLSQKQQGALVRKSIIETGKTLAEAGPLLFWKTDYIEQHINSVEGEDLIRQAMRQRSGVIIAFPHVGAWELLSLFCSRRYPMTTLYRKPRLQELDSIVKQGRERFGARLVQTDASGVRALLEALNRGETIGLLPDQEPPQGCGVFAPFFDVSAYSMTLVSQLARRTGASVVIGYARRLSRGAGYNIYFRMASDDIHDPSTDNSVNALNRDIAQCIREVPEQYQWIYKRFRKRPAGAQPVYT
ncbi:lysophospholipid acyltransferase family protein [Thiohalophilus thiocyanatoxydans]|uniref:KDO2-lipid IV(A) lauroyltransferase n=1 Tax=Thiohalophilus thiocyanatoxydans TaxID=381308 RepID=A0A4R8IST0_9GAMM|nr:lysophospholipid acyltransferase family protein [Thiohalophilus thiocyanatoxydans]TDY00619.1 KDO2-lipid IV(A) lauroyltransferase [Thiohalophilus thiocyanatoxydans]